MKSAATRLREKRQAQLDARRALRAAPTPAPPPPKPAAPAIAIANYRFEWDAVRLNCHYDLTDGAGKRWHVCRHGGSNRPGTGPAVHNDRVGWHRQVRDCLWSECRDAGIDFPYESKYEREYEPREYYAIVAKTPLAPPPQLATEAQVRDLNAKIAALNAALATAVQNGARQAEANQQLRGQLSQLHTQLAVLLAAL